MPEINYVLLEELEAWLRHELAWRQRIESPSDFCKGEMTMIERLAGSLVDSRKRLQNPGDSIEKVVSDHLAVTLNLDQQITELKHRVAVLEVISAGAVKEIA